MYSLNDAHCIVITVALFTLVSVLKLFSNYVIAPTYLSWRARVLPSETTQGKFRIAFFKLVFYISAVTLGIFVLKNENWAYTLHLLTPVKEIPLKFKIYYFYEISFYMTELITIFYEPKKKDFFQMVAHHITTLFLMYLSFDIRYIHFGVVILLLHDISDPLLELAKVEHYVKKDSIANTTIFIFTAVFIVSRLFIYPRFIVYQVWLYVKKDISTWPNWTLILLLLFLQVMHIIWTGYILMLFVKLINGEKLEDTREKKKNE